MAEREVPYPAPPIAVPKEEELHIGESKISKAFSERTTKRVIILILSMLFLL